MSGARTDLGSDDAPSRTPLFEAQEAPRYSRQELIRAYQERFGCRLVVLIGRLAPYSISLFEETLYDIGPSDDLHLLLQTPGGDGEAALRLLRQAQDRSSELSVIVPDIAKSAGTLLALGAHHILMGPTSDLGPIDPQLNVADGSSVAAKSIIAAVNSAFDAIVERPETLPLHAILLADTTAADVQQARDAMNYADDLLREALACQPDRSEQENAELVEKLTQPLIGEPNDHGATIPAARALELGLPVIKLDPTGEQWRMIWRLWARYFNMGDVSVYEGERASQIFRAS